MIKTISLPMHHLRPSILLSDWFYLLLILSFFLSLLLCIPDLCAMCFIACGYKSETDSAGQQPSPEGCDVLLPQQ